MKFKFLSLLLVSFIFITAQTKTPEIVTAAAKKNIGKVKKCIRKGNDVNAKSRSKWSALSYAVKNNDLIMAKLLLEHGANVDITINTKESPLLMAAKYNNARMAKLLIQNSADVNFKDIMQFTVVHWAAKNGNKELLDLLLSNGAKINARNINGRSPLDVAKPNVKSYLKEKGAKTGKELFEEATS